MHPSLPLGLATICSALVAGGCALVDVQTIRGSGELTTTMYDGMEFDELEVRRGYDLRLTPGTPTRVAITADDNVMEFLEVGVVDGTLRLDVDDGVNIADVTLVAEVTAPGVRRIGLHSGASAELAGRRGADDLELSLSGGSDLRCSTVEAGALVLTLGGGSDASCTDVTTDRLEAALDGGSELQLDGTVASAALSGSGSSEFALFGLRLAGADVRLSGGSHADLDVSGVLEVDLRDGSDVRYRGDPVIGSVDLADGSTLEPAS